MCRYTCTVLIFTAQHRQHSTYGDEGHLGHITALKSSARSGAFMAYLTKSGDMTAKYIPYLVRVVLTYGGMTCFKKQKENNRASTDTLT